MSLIKDAPQDLPTTDALADIPDDLLGPVPAVIRLSGKDLLVMESPPNIGDFVKMEITMRCKDDGRTLLADGEIGHYRVMSFVAAKVTADPYKPEPEPEPEPEPGLLDEAMNINPDAISAEDQEEDGLRTCTNCTEQAACLSSRNWCDGCEESADTDPEFSHNGDEQE